MNTYEVQVHAEDHAKKQPKKVKKPAAREPADGRAAERAVQPSSSTKTQDSDMIYVNVDPTPGAPTSDTMYENIELHQMSLSSVSIKPVILRCSAL